MTRTRFRKLCLVAMAALLAIGSSVLVASAGTRAKPPAAKEIKLACIKADGTLAYVTRSRQCRGRNKLLRIKPGPVDVCVKHHGTRRGARAAGNGRRLPAGSTRHTDELGLCGPGTQPNEFPLRLPSTQREWFCVEKGDKTMRWVPRKPRNAKADIPVTPRDLRCRTRGRFPEFPAYVKPGGPFEEPGGGGAPQQPANKAPTGENDSASTDEDTSKQIAVLANDTDADGDALSVESVDTTGTRGDVRVNADGTITWDPAGRFDLLAPGDSTNDSFKYKAHDGQGGHTGTTHVDVSVTGVNDAPKVTTSTGNASVTEQGPATAVDGGLGVSDPDSPNLTRASVTIAAGLDASDDLLFTNQNGISGTYDSGTGVLTLTGTASVADYQTALRSVRFAAGGDDPAATRAIQFRVKDSSAESAPASRTVDVTPVNDAPVNDVPGAQTTDEDVMAVFSDANSNRISVADADSRSDQLDVEVSVGAGTLTLGNTAVVSSVVGDGTPNVTFRGSRAEANTALDGLTYQPDFNYNGSDTLTITTDDLGHNGTGGAHSDMDTVGITVTAVNDAPINTVPDTQTLDEDGNTTVSNGFSVNDVDGGTNPVKTTLSVTHGTITVDPGATLSGNGTGTVELTGSQGDVNTSLLNVKYEPAANDDATRTVTMTTNDQGNSPAPAEEDTDTVDFVIHGVNDAPEVTVPSGTQTIDEDTSKTFTGSAISVADVDAAGSDIEATLTVGHGTLTVGTTMAGLVVTGADSDNLTLTGTLTEVNDALDGLVYNPTGNYNGNDTLSVAVNDQGSTGSGGALSDSETVAISVTPVNDAPVNAVPATQSTDEDTPKTLSGGDAPSVSDVDAGSDPLKVTLTVTDGTVELDGTTGLSGVTGNGSGGVSFTGSQSATNAALDGLEFSPTGNFSGTASVELKTEDQGSTGSGGDKSDTDSFDITVNAVNDAPVNAVPATQSTDEDTPKTLSGGDAPSVSDVDAGSDPLKVTLTVTDGTVELDGTTGLSGVTGDGSGGVSFTGSQSDTNAALDGMEFTPSGDFSGTASVELKTEDQGSTGSGGDKSDTDSFDITVNAVNDKPSVLASGPPTPQFTEGGSAIVIDGGVSITDVDSADLNRVTVAITSGHQGTDVLEFTTTNGIQGSYDSGTGVLTLTPDGPATAPQADFEAAARTVKFTTPSASPGASRTIAFRARDDANAESDDVATARRDITIDQNNSKPVVTPTAGEASYTEDGPAVAVDPTIDVTDGDSANLVGATVQITTGYSNGEDTLEFTDTAQITGSFTPADGKMTLSGTATVAQYESALQSVKFTTTAQNPSSSRTAAFQVDDGEGVDNLSDVVTRDIAITTVNDKPVVTATGGNTLYTEQADSTVVDSGLSITDADSATLTGATVTIGAFRTGDLLTYTNPSGSGITATYNGGTGVLSLSSAPTVTIATYEQVLQSVAFSSSSDDPGPSRDIQFTVNDGAAFDNLSDVAHKGILITETNDAPVLTQPDGALTYTEDDPSAKHHLPIAPNLTASDADSANLTGATVTIGSGYQNGQDELTVAGPLPGGITFSFSTSTGTATLGGSATVDNYRDALRAVRYRNTSDAPDTTERRIDFQADDGQAENHASNVASRTVEVVSVNDLPTADNETFDANDSAHGNTTLQVDAPGDDKPAPTDPHTEITGNILAGDTDPDGPDPLKVVGGTFTTNDGGSVTIEEDGDFVFHPKASTSCTDTSDFFNYTVDDGDGTGTSGPAPDNDPVGQVTIAIAGCVWYVNNNHSGSSDNLGTSNAPFDTLAQAETASGDNHTVFVFDGNNSSTGYDEADGYSMNSGERLIGEHEGLVVDQDGSGSTYTPDTLRAANANAHPTLTASGSDVITLNSGNEIRGIQVDPSGTGGGIRGAAGDINGTLDDVRIIDTGTVGQQPGLQLSGTSGGTGWNISNLTVDNSGASTTPPSTAKGVVLNGAGTVNFASAGTISLTTKGAAALDADTTNMGTGSQFDSITTTASSSGGVRLFNTTGTTQLGNLNLATTSSTEAALRVSSGGTVSVPGAGTSNISANGGPAVSVDGTPGISLALNVVSSTNSATGGITLSDMGAGTFSASSGAIDGAAGTAFSVSGGSGTITYSGNLNNGTGPSASVTSRTGGTVTLSGQINDTNDPGGGVTVSNNTGGATVLNNATKTLNTGSSPALVFTGSNNHTLTVQNGLNVTTTSGPGVQATGLGVGTRSTLNIPAGGTNPNVITTGSGRALEVSQLDVGAAPLGFRSISSNGASNGILLNDTGPNNALTVSGTATADPCTAANTTGCTGGTIQNTTGADSSTTTPPGTGVVLKDTKGVSLTRMRLANNTNYGIRGHNLSGFTLQTSVINGTNGTTDTDPFDDGAIRMTELTGAALIDASHISGGYQDNISVENTAGTLNRFTLQNSSIGANSTVGGNDGVFLESLVNTPAVINATIQNTTFTASRGDHVQVTYEGNNGGDLDFVSNTLSNNHPATGANGTVAFTGGTSGLSTMDAIGNTIRDSDGPAFKFLKSSGTGSLDSTFDQNTVGVSGVPNSGSKVGSGFSIDQRGGGVASIDVTNNLIQQYNNMGIELVAGGGVAGQSGQLNALVSGNLVREPGTNDPPSLPSQGFHVNSGTGPGDTFLTCLDIGPNTILGSGTSGGQDFRVRQRQSTRIKLISPSGGYTGTPYDTTAVENFIKSELGGTPPTGAALTEGSPSPGYVGGTSCP